MGNSPKKVEEAGLGKKTLETNQMKKDLNKLAKQIKLRVEKYIKYRDIK